MEVKIESKVGVLRSDINVIYGFLSDCTNFKKFTENEKIKDLQVDIDSFSFAVDEMGIVSFHIIERRPNELIKFSIENAKAESMFLWVQLKSVSTIDTRVKLTAKLEVNSVMSMIIKKPLKNGLDKVVETLEYVCTLQ